MPQFVNNPNQYFSAYNKFTSENKPIIDSQASNKLGGFLNDFSKSKFSYNKQSPADYMSNAQFAQLGESTGKLANYSPENINVGQVESLPVSYYQKQVEDLSKPLEAQYERARSLSRGDQAARGTLYDSEGYRDIGDLDKNYLETLGGITRGVQLQRMKEMQENQRDNINRSLMEDQARRALGLEGLTRGAAQTSDLAKFFVDAGQKESQLGVTSQLQQLGLDANMINNLLGYGADRYGSEADLFKSVYGTDVDYNQAKLQDQAKQQADFYDSLIDLAGLPGFQDVPQTQLWEKIAESLLPGELNFGHDQDQ